MSSRLSWLSLVVSTSTLIGACVPILETPHFRDSARGDATASVDVTAQDVLVGDVAHPSDAVMDAIAVDATPVDSSVGEASVTDVVATVDVLVSTDAISSDAIVVDGGRACEARSPLYACPEPTNCAGLQTALQSVFTDAQSVPCCDDSDCSFVFSPDLCCSEEGIIVGASLEAECLRSLLALTSHFSPCPAACTARACRIVTGGRCIGGTCSPVFGG